MSPTALPATPQGPATPAASSREIRVDFFRGIAMFIIFIAHTPGNPWTLWIPARFGASDGAEMFVFCSGFASAMAFGAVFAKRGFALGCARVAFRVWQIYWAHIALFLTIAAVLVVGTELVGEDLAKPKNYVARLNLLHFFNDAQTGLVHLLTLTYVPNLFDILPMYIVVLMLIPVMVALQRLHVLAFVAGAFALWLAAPHIALPAEWWSERKWFFNPFAWQLIFFTGFAIGARWIRPPKPDRKLAIAALVFVIVLIPICYFRIYREVELFGDIRKLFTGDNIQFGLRKTNFGILRWLHFIALAYLMYCFFHAREHWLRQPWVKPVLDVGRQSLAVFLFSMVLGRIGGMVFDVIGKSWTDLLLVNLGGFFILWCVARLAGWFKSSPWRTRRRPQATPGAASDAAELSPSKAG